MTAVKDQNDRLREGTLPEDPAEGAEPVEPSTETRRAVSRQVPGQEPNDAQAEASLLATFLGCGANAPETVKVTSVIDLVPDPDVLFVPAHAQIYRTMQSLAAEGKPVDVVTVHSDLARDRRARMVGGIEYLEQLEMLAESCSVAKARAYAQAIRDTWLRRRGVAAAERAIETLRAGAVPAAEAIFTAIDLLRPIGEAVSSDAGTVSLKQSVKEVFEALRSDEPVEYFATGVRDLDELLSGGLFPRETTVLAARTSVGKSALATQIAINIAERYERVAALYVTLEMPAKSFTRRLVASRAGVDGRKIRRKTLNEFEMAALTRAAMEIANRCVFFAQSQSQTILSVHAMATTKARALAIEGKRLGLIVIDHIGLLKPSDPGARRGKRNEEVGENSRGLRFLAEQHGCHVIALAQVNREFEKRKGAMPLLSEIKDSGAIEEDADNVCILHRKKDDKGMFIQGEPAWLAVAKSRNDETGIFELGFDRAHTRFTDWNGAGGR